MDLSDKQEHNADGNLSSLVSKQTQDLVPDEYTPNLGSFNDKVGANRVEIMASGKELNSFGSFVNDMNPINVAKRVSGTNLSISELSNTYNPITVAKRVSGTNLSTSELWNKYNPTQVAKDITGTNLGLSEMWNKYNPGEVARGSWEVMKKNMPIISMLTGLSVMRGAFYVLTTQNVFGIATKLNEKKKSSPSSYANVLSQWKKWGGKTDKLERAIDKGKTRQEKRTNQYKEMSWLDKAGLGMRTGGIGNLIGGSTGIFSADGSDTDEIVGSDRSGLKTDFEGYELGEGATVGVAAAIVAAAPLVMQVFKMIGAKADAEADQELLNQEYENNKELLDIANQNPNMGYGASDNEGQFTDSEYLIGLTQMEWIMISGGVVAALATTFFIIKAKKK